LWHCHGATLAEKKRTLNRLSCVPSVIMITIVTRCANIRVIRTLLLVLIILVISIHTLETVDKQTTTNSSTTVVEGSVTEKRIENLATSAAAPYQLYDEKKRNKTMTINHYNDEVRVSFRIRVRISNRIRVWDSVSTRVRVRCSEELTQTLTLAVRVTATLTLTLTLTGLLSRRR
jgi:hypothetical protein